MKPSLWVSGGGGPTANADEQKARVAAEAARIRPVAEAANKIGCTVGLYNHGGWFGEPENQIEIIEALRAGDAPVTNVGIVYNQHHGHVHAGRFRELLARMKPYLQVLNLNGMFADGEARGLKIAPIGTGEQDLELLKVVQESGFDGPFGILNHTQLDAEDRLRDNIVGLEWVAAKLDGKDPGALPRMKTWEAPAAAPKAAAAPSGVMPHDPSVVAALAAEAKGEGASAANGARVFTRHTLACISCHKVGEHGGNVGPALSKLGSEKTHEQIAESLLWPQHVVQPEFRTVTVVTADGASRRGYRERDDDATIVLRDPASGARETLAKADIGFAMAAAGTDTAIETADVALMDDDPRKLAEFVRLSRTTRSVLWQNIVLAIGIKAVFLVLTMTGHATLWMAVFADMGTSLLVVFNGMRLLRHYGSASSSA